MKSETYFKLLDMMFAFILGEQSEPNTNEYIEIEIPCLFGQTDRQTDDRQTDVFKAPP